MGIVIFNWELYKFNWELYYSNETVKFNRVNFNWDSYNSIANGKIQYLNAKRRCVVYKVNRKSKLQM